MRSPSPCASLYNTRLDTPQAMCVLHVALRGRHPHAKMPRTSNKMLKKSASFVLASFRPSTGTQPPHLLGGAHRRGAPYSSHRAPQRVRLGPSLAAALLNELFEHLVGTTPHSADRLSSSQTHRGYEVFGSDMVFLSLLGSQH